MEETKKTETEMPALISQDEFSYSIVNQTEDKPVDQEEKQHNEYSKVLGLLEKLEQKEKEFDTRLDDIAKKVENICENVKICLNYASGLSKKPNKKEKVEPPPVECRCRTKVKSRNPDSFNKCDKCQKSFHIRCVYPYTRARSNWLCPFCVNTTVPEKSD